MWIYIYGPVHLFFANKIQLAMTLSRTSCDVLWSGPCASHFRKPVSHNWQSDNYSIFFFFKPTRQRSSSKNNWWSEGDAESCSNSKFEFCWKRSREMPMKAIDLCVGSWSVWVWLIMTVNQFTSGKVLLMENRVDPGWSGMCDFLSWEIHISCQTLSSPFWETHGWMQICCALIHSFMNQTLA